MMRKLQSLLVVALISGGSFAQNNDSEMVPYANNESANNYDQFHTTNSDDRAPWDILHDSDPTSVTVSLAGAFWTGTEFWVTQWNSDSLYVVDASGAMVSGFTIPGVSGARSITSDGTRYYIGGAGADIYQIDPGTQTLVSTISTSGLNCRYLTFDPTLDGGNGGFWTGQYGDDITAVSMTGATLSVLPAATHTLTGVYGMAYDGYSSGGPYLWAYDQGTTGYAMIVQLDMTGTPTGVTHDTQSDLAGGNTGLGGGLFFATNWPGQDAVIGGLNQGVSLFVYEMTAPAGVEENEASSFSIYPNPVVDNLTIQLTEGSIELVSIYTIDGQLVRTENSTSKTINVADLTEGVYILQVQTENGISNQKFVKK